MNRRKFLGQSAAVAAGFGMMGLTSCSGDKKKLVRLTGKPLVLSTWRHGLAANEAAWEILKQGGYSLDAVEAGVRVSEADPDVTSVGYGGYPDRDGHVTLDACIMNEKGDAGSVCFLRNIMHPISVARLVMEKTPHVMLSGEGALRFALGNGFQKEELLTEGARGYWKKWIEENQYQPVIDENNHDTISMIAIDAEGRLSGACTTSGAAMKMHGRVGDSPIIGAGLYVDNEVGGAASTGQGELAMKTLGSFLIVELMRNGMSPQQACEEAVRRSRERIPEGKDYQISYLAVNIAGEIGASSIYHGFQYAVCHDDENLLFDAPALADDQQRINRFGE